MCWFQVFGYLAILRRPPRGIPAVIVNFESSGSTSLQAGALTGLTTLKWTSANGCRMWPKRFWLYISSTINQFWRYIYGNSRYCFTHNFIPNFHKNLKKQNKISFYFRIIKWSRKIDKVLNSQIWILRNQTNLLSFEIDIIKYFLITNFCRNPFFIDFD